MSIEHTVTFAELGLPEALMDGVRRAGFERCTPIQAQTLPVALAGRDVAGQGQTGTGKTAAFLLSTFNQILKLDQPPAGNQPAPRAVIMAPTRELAVQIHSDAEILGYATGLKLAVVYGGENYDKQRETLEQGVDVLVGTPGRLIDYYKQGIFTLNKVQVFVLDEADRMFDLGFINDIRYVMRRLPPHDQRLNLMFSATLGQRVLELAYEHMNEPVTIQIEPDKKTVDAITQLIYFPSNEEKPRLLIGLLRQMNARRTMVFVNTKRTAEVVAKLMELNGFAAEAISGDVPQRKRLRMLRDFQSGELPVLIATDVASRGLHVPDVSHVINYDLPQDIEDYVHRIGRTARAGASGDAISFACETYAFSLPDIENFIGHRIPSASVDPDMLAEVVLPPRGTGMRPRREGPGGRSRPGGGGGRPGGGRGGRSGPGPSGGSGGPGRSGPGGGRSPRRDRQDGAGSGGGSTTAQAERPAAASMPASAGPAPAGGTPAGDGVQKKRRRRRRKPAGATPAE
jgi:ATP-dependent RNA helicase RhlB